MTQPAITPRSEWGGDLVPTGVVPDEPDVRFLLVHHSVDGNGYSAGEVVGLLRAIYALHTSPDKGWPDIAYNFFVDRFGGIWEGRTGSLAGAKAGDATGGSQGFAQLVCLLGDHRTVPPTPEAQASLVATLAWLADRHGLDVSPGATTTFTSRGSNKWPAGASVTAATISGHRDMTFTECPGDAAYGLVADGTLATRATALRTPAPTTTTPTTEPPTTTTTAPTTTSTTAAPPTTSTAAAPTTSVGIRTFDDGSDSRWPPAIAATTGVAAVLGALVALRRRRL